MAHGRQQRRNKSRGAVGVTYCFLCGFEAEDNDAFRGHLEELRHKYNFKLAEFKNKRKHKAKNRHGVEINVCCKGKKIDSTSDGTVKYIIDPETSNVVYEFEVKFTGGRRIRHVSLVRAMLLHPYKAFKINDKFNISAGAEVELRLQPGASYVVKVTFSNCGIGTYGVPVCFTLVYATDSARKEFDIIRVMVVNVIGPDHRVGDVESQKDSPFTCEPWFDMDITVSGTMPDGRKINRLLEYAIPQELQILFEHGLLPWDGIDLHMTDKLLSVLTMYDNDSVPDKDNYADYFHTLLYLDEHMAKQMMEKYNMENVPLEIISETRLQLQVPGLAEQRPSLLKGDIIYVRVSLGKGKWEHIEYEGVVADVRESCIWIGGFDSELMERLEKKPDLRFDVHFSFNRFSLFVMHRAIDMLVKEDKFHVVFPPDLSFPPLRIQGNIEFINPLIRTNPEQREAVTNILLGTSRPSPYIIFGPPGTGKTVTVVEAILQVKKKLKQSCILVCAPSNSACDWLAQKLIPHCTTKELLRLHSSSRDWSAIPEELHPYSNLSKCTFYFPDETQLASYRIVVCTLISSGRLLKKRDGSFDPTVHFTHIFIDECGQAMEPETLVPLVGILGTAMKYQPGGQVILAGDPLQLGPVCHSNIAEKLCLGISLMERLMNKWKHYSKESEERSYNSKFITKLRRNFRSHALILEVPNKLFYDGELIPACGIDVTNDTVKNLKNDLRFDRAVVFHGVIGHEKREGRAPSYFNLYELETVVRYVQDLLKGGPSREPVQQEDIGILAPYIRQVYKLKAKLKHKAWENIEVGTTETFQGREKRVIIVSTVRSQRNLLELDSKLKLGFVANAKRFNVAITRARSLLIIVGNPHILEADERWRHLINFCCKLNSYRGCRYSPREDEWVQQIVERFEKLNKD
ncbi:hypothetical protein B7P43_G01458 [Cryptotermes secundus]|uniref:RNA helicase n=2 Tax=Cryptotermes secundus TaxID=105785 RepID=A0A2J7RK32_9NEOP|nr:putative helicase mov-10-B.1 isoform X2 [Cryptotermes secundus]XP_023724855.1 putative helicase mov-10-B.1 isoform X2 [Cryptotermes secundus]XP_023724862.1 putative helicase mov-10-B.1 isoform X2 [Cryptotermes secundus]XP_023724871.1 putative helicase mov-10-B.1 isoform X2 [Cryptotermes secundus]XP_033611319.1 putative helicase mov-10-B.1 isoform X2 [Cryptotermes secundus]PNF41191.1 hypothetical protein B7P43_G01458 [Cryptotermes secundus]PNF41192.1 hypothetical protein B7P43_G01458 [Crypt